MLIFFDDYDDASEYAYRIDFSRAFYGSVETPARILKHTNGKYFVDLERIENLDGDFFTGVKL